MDYSINNNNVVIEYSKFGLIEIKNSTLNQSLEIVRKRIDEVGTKDPTIIRRGNERIFPDSRHYKVVFDLIYFRAAGLC